MAPSHGLLRMISFFFFNLDVLFHIVASYVVSGFAIRTVADTYFFIWKLLRTFLEI